MIIVIKERGNWDFEDLIIEYKCNESALLT